jgi:hypothetical protein
MNNIENVMPISENQPNNELPLINGSSCLSNVLYLWSFQLLKTSQGKLLKIDDLPGLSE